MHFGLFRRDEHFEWRAGDWHLELDVRAENEAKTFERDFTLSRVRPIVSARLSLCCDSAYRQIWQHC